MFVGLYLATLLLLATGTSFAEPPGEPPLLSDEDVFDPGEARMAVERGWLFLKKSQHLDGSWGGIKFNSSYGGGSTQTEGYRAGLAALCTYTLLRAGVPRKDDSVKRAFTWLKQHHELPDNSMDAAMLLLAITATATPEDKRLPTQFRSWAVKLANHLVAKRTARGWRYNRRGHPDIHGGPEDVASTQLAALALFCAHKKRVRVANRVWEDILGYTLQQQDATGPEVEITDPHKPLVKHKARARGFAYNRGAGDESDGGMTAAALATLSMVRYAITLGGKRPERWTGRPDAEALRAAYLDGLAWLTINWTPYDNPDKGTLNRYNGHWLWMLACAMDLGRIRHIGKHNWYRHMGRQILNRQYADGSWDLGNKPQAESLDTCFAVLFLTRASKGLTK